MDKCFTIWGTFSQMEHYVFFYFSFHCTYTSMISYQLPKLTGPLIESGPVVYSFVGSKIANIRSPSAATLSPTRAIP